MSSQSLIIPSVTDYIYTYSWNEDVSCLQVPTFLNLFLSASSLIACYNCSNLHLPEKQAHSIILSGIVGSGSASVSLQLFLVTPSSTFLPLLNFLSLSLIPVGVMFMFSDSLDYQYMLLKSLTFQDIIKAVDQHFTENLRK